MGKKTRRAFKKNLSWKKINTIERRTSIGIGVLNVNGWNAISENDVIQATLSENLDIFSLIETKKKPGSKRITIEGFKVYETRRKAR